MKRTLICLALALAMTVPVGVGLAHIPGVGEWFASGAGYEFFAPVFKALDSGGGENNTDIIVGTLYVVSFVFSLALAAAFSAIISHFRRTHRC